MRQWQQTQRKKARIEIIPMIDVMMFLLVFFVLISVNVIPALGIKTEQPNSSQVQPLKLQLYRLQSPYPYQKRILSRY